MDFSAYPKTSTYFGGSERKIGIMIGESEYMVKFQKKTAFGIRNNHISEYLGSRIFSLLGFEVQETYLGTYEGENVVACKVFIPSGTQFVPFNDIGESTLEHDKEIYQYEYEEIMQMLRDNSKLTDVEETISSFWEIFIVDALLGNFDRHGANWGFLKTDNKYRLAPVFDSGSSLFPSLTDEDEMLKIIDSEEETNKRIYTFPTSQVKLNGKKSSYYDVISSRQFPECNAALEKIYNRINIDEIFELIDDTENLSEIQKKFYKHMIEKRYDKIIKAPYLALEEVN